MICFLDKTFCDAFPARCSNDRCHRAFTEARRIDCRRWWDTFKIDADAPVATADFYADCPDKVPA